MTRFPGGVLLHWLEPAEIVAWIRDSGVPTSGTYVV